MKGDKTMNLEIANRLVEYRKKAGLSQEELADKLGISRQAISKWERVEASPDTDNLIALAKLYNVSLDELIYGKMEGEKAVPEDAPKDNAEAIVVEQEVVDNDVAIVEDDDEKVEDKNEPKEKKKRVHIVARLNGIFSLLAVFGYVALGCFWNGPFAYAETGAGWAVGWILFLAFPIIPSIVDCIVSKRFCKFNMPCAVLSVFCFLGMMYNLWHPFWVLFFVIPVFYTLFGWIDSLFTR